MANHIIHCDLGSSKWKFSSILIKDIKDRLIPIFLDHTWTLKSSCYGFHDLTSIVSLALV